MASHPNSCTAHALRLVHPLKGHRWGTGQKRCPARARRTNVPPVGPLTTNSAFFSFVAGFLHVLIPAAVSAQWSGKRGLTGHAVPSASRTCMTSGRGSMTLSANAATVIIQSAAAVSISARSAFVVPKGPNLLGFCPLAREDMLLFSLPVFPGLYKGENQQEYLQIIELNSTITSLDRIYLVICSLGILILGNLFAMLLEQRDHYGGCLMVGNP